MDGLVEENLIRLLGIFRNRVLIGVPLEAARREQEQTGQKPET